MMNVIYSSARRVCVWLGEVPNMPSLYRLVVHIVPLVVPPAKRTRSIRDRITRLGEVLLIPAHLLFRNTIASALSSRHRHPLWHTRAWVYPELNNAREHVWCFGPFSRTDEPAKLARFLIRTRDLPYGVNDRKKRDVLIKLGSLLARSTEYTWPNRFSGFRSTTLLQNAVTTARMRATDLRDKVYSLIGVTCADEAVLLRPDYSKSVAQVFAEATFASIAGSQNFDALYYAIATRFPVDSGFWDSGVTDLPTWGIDFSISYITAPSLFFGQRGAGTSSKVRFERNSSQPRLSPCLRRLHLQIIVLDVLSITLSAFLRREDRHVETLVVAFLRLCDSVKVQAGGAVMSEQINSIRTTLGIDGPPFNRTAVTYDTETLSASLAAFDCNASASRSWFHKSLPFILHSRKSVEYESTAQSSALKAIATYPDYRLHLESAMFLTSSGLLGIGHPSASANDIVVLVENSRLPIILRPVGNEYTFVGLAHIGSAEDRQLDALWEHGKVPLQDVTIM